MSMSYNSTSVSLQPDKPLPVENPFSTAAGTPTPPIRVTFQRGEARPSLSRAPTSEAGGDTATDLTAYIGQAHARDLAELRAHFNKPSHGEWGIIYDPIQSYWIGMHGKNITVYARSMEELRNRITSRCWDVPFMK